LRQTSLRYFFNLAHIPVTITLSYFSLQQVMSLAVPPPHRSRASSTNIRPALTINTLGRRRSSSLVLPIQQSEPSTPSTPSVDKSHLEPSQILASPQPDQKHSMFAVIASSFLDLLHVPTTHSINWSTPSSPQSTVHDEFVLPISASSQQTTFSDIFNDKDALRTHARWWRPPSVSSIPPSHPTQSDPLPF
jgi:hypothetical protein